MDGGKENNSLSAGPTPSSVKLSMILIVLDFAEGRAQIFLGERKGRGGGRILLYTIKLRLQAPVCMCLVCASVCVCVCVRVYFVKKELWHRMGRGGLDCRRAEQKGRDYRMVWGSLGQAISTVCLSVIKKISNPAQRPAFENLSIKVSELKSDPILVKDSWSMSLVPSKGTHIRNESSTCLPSWLG